MAFVTTMTVVNVVIYLNIKLVQENIKNLDYTSYTYLIIKCNYRVYLHWETEFRENHNVI